MAAKVRMIPIPILNCHYVLKLETCQNSLNNIYELFFEQVFNWGPGPKITFLINF